MGKKQRTLEELYVEYSSSNPTLLAETPVSAKVLWRCSLGHEWKATIHSRASAGTGCPYCTNRRLLSGFNDVATKHPFLISEWSDRNEDSPHNTLASGSTVLWWKCSLDHEWDAKLFHRVSSRSGCPYCANKKVLIGFNDLETTHPHLVKDWSESNKTSPQDHIAGTTTKVWWKCNKNHEWLASINSRTSARGGTGCPYCTNKKVLAGYNDLSTTHPEIAKEWSDNNKISPTEVTAGSKKKVLWVCSYGHEWLASPEKRKIGRGCPTCANKDVKAGFNDIITTAPILARQWSKNNSTTPEQVSAGSNEEFLWVCKNNHEWKASPHARASGTRGCPFCSGKRVLASYNDLLSLHPHLAQEWSEKNELGPDEIVAGSKTHRWWICSKGHEWRATPDNRIRAKSGCPHCSRRISKMETEVADFLKSLLPEVEVRTSVRDVIAPKELDIYIPAKNLAVEFNGLYWHTEAQGKDKDYHRDKWRACHDKGIQLIQVWEDQWRDKPDVVKRMLAHKVGASQERRVAARKTEVVLLDKVEAEEFLESYHIQGFASGSYYLGLRIKGEQESVALMVLKKQGEDMILSRYATSAHVVGGQSKLVKYAERNFEYARLITFADLEVSDGSLYERTGFVKDKELKPDYRYLFDGERRHKFGFRLKRFREDPDLLFEEGLSERELALLNGIERLWDTGKIRYVKPHPDSLESS